MIDSDSNVTVPLVEAYFPGPSGTLAWTLEHQVHRTLINFSNFSVQEKIKG